MQLTIPQITIGVLYLKPRPYRPLYLETWPGGSLMLGLWRFIFFVTVWPKYPEKTLYEDE